MLKLIRADVYRLFHRPYLFVFTAILSALGLLFNSLFADNPSALASFKGSLTFLVCLPFFAVMIVDITLAEEIKNSTLKNTVYSGLGRARIFAAKFITSLLLTLIVALITFNVYAGSALWWLKWSNLNQEFMLDYLLRIAITMLLVAGSLSVAMLFAVMFQKNAVYAFTFAGAMFLPTVIFKGFSFKFVAFGWLYRATILGQTYELLNIPTSRFYEPILVAVLHIVLFWFLGYLIFKKQEIN